MFERSGSKSSANARALWRFHDRRWEERKIRDGEPAAPNNDDEDSDEEEEDESIDDEVDRRIGTPFSFQRAVEVALECLASAQRTLEERKAEMEAWADADGAHFLETFIHDYETESERWRFIEGRLALCTTTLGESFLDSSIRHGWI